MKKLIFMFLVVSYSFASFFNGNHLYKDGLEYYKHNIGQEGSFYSDGFYTGYVSGVYDSYAGVLFCPTGSVSLGQVCDIVLKYLQDHPEVRNKPANEIVVDALKEVWPCKKR